MAEKNDPMIPDGDVNPIDTDYQVGQDNIIVNVGPFGLDIHNRVFAVSGLAVIAFVLLTLLFHNQVEPLFGSIRSWLTTNLSWFFLLGWMGGVGGWGVWKSTKIQWKSIKKQWKTIKKKLTSTENQWNMSSARPSPSQLLVLVSPRGGRNNFSIF